MNGPEGIGKSDIRRQQFQERRVSPMVGDTYVLHCMSHLLKKSDLGLPEGLTVGGVMYDHLKSINIWALDEEIDEALWRNSEIAIQENSAEKERGGNEA
jgi:hypothetical protein